MAGSRLIRVPKARAVRRRRARSSKLNGSTGCSAASASMAASSGQVTACSPEGPAAGSAAMPATGMETASPAEAGDPVADVLDQQDVGAPAGRGSRRWRRFNGKFARRDVRVSRAAPSRQSASATSIGSAE
jgi:hypothetical protein